MLRRSPTLRLRPKCRIRPHSPQLPQSEPPPIEAPQPEIAAGSFEMLTEGVFDNAITARAAVDPDARGDRRRPRRLAGHG